MSKPDIWDENTESLAVIRYIISVTKDPLQNILYPREINTIFFHEGADIKSI